MPAGGDIMIEINHLMYDRGRGPELRSCRITIYDLLPYLLSGQFTDAQILTDVFRMISADELEALKQYIDEHRDEVMEKHRQIEETIRKRIEEQAATQPGYLERWKRMRAFAQFMKERKNHESSNGPFSKSEWRQVRSEFDAWYGVQGESAQVKAASV
jgi:hypothetical protein